MLGVLALLSVLGQERQRVPAREHIHRFIAVSADVRLEVVDWGGRGPAVVFLAGFGNSAHVFDGFAPEFTRDHRVIAITRRGFGASSKPRTGFDSATLVADVTAVLDSLQIRRATFVGHSFAGSELNSLGAFHADRVERLIYLDASYDFPRLYADTVWQRAFPIPRPSVPTTNTLAEWRRWFALVMGAGVPDDELRVLTSGGTQDSLSSMLQRGTAPSAFTRIKVPVLALWATPGRVEDQYPYWASLDSTARARLLMLFEQQESVRRKQLQQFRQQVPNAKLVTVPGGRHYLFLSHPREISTAIYEFLRSGQDGHR
jgi:pimeloyl-ACP methyl ester carboxylesterase